MSYDFFCDFLNILYIVKYEFQSQFTKNILKIPHMYFQSFFSLIKYLSITSILIFIIMWDISFLNFLFALCNILSFWVIAPDLNVLNFRYFLLLNISM